MEVVVKIRVEKLPEGVYLATSEEVPGLVAQGRTITETLEIARDVIRFLGRPPFGRSHVPRAPSLHSWQIQLAVRARASRPETRNAPPAEVRVRALPVESVPITHDFHLGELIGVVLGVQIRSADAAPQHFEQQRDRDTLSVALQFRPHEKLDIEFNSLNVKADYDNISHSMFAFNGNTWNALGNLTDLTVDGGVITSASFRNALTVYDLINRQATVDTDSYDLKVTWRDEGWFASAHAGTSKATGGTGRQVFGEFLNKAHYSYDLTGASPTLQFGGYQRDPIADVASHFAPGNPDRLASKPRIWWPASLRGSTGALLRARYSRDA